MTLETLTPEILVVSGPRDRPGGLPDPESFVASIRIQQTGADRMAEDYIYDPRTLNPMVAGLAAGSVGAIAASLISLPVASPNETVANPLTATIVAMLIGVLSGFVWRSVRATTNGARTFVIAMVAGLLVVLSTLAIIEWTAGGGWFTYTALVAGVIFLSVALLTPVISRAVAPIWAAMIPVALAVIVALGLFVG